MTMYVKEQRNQRARNEPHEQRTYRFPGLMCLRKKRISNGQDLESVEVRLLGWKIYEVETKIGVKHVPPPPSIEKLSVEELVKNSPRVYCDACRICVLLAGIDEPRLYMNKLGWVHIDEAVYCATCAAEMP